MTWADAGLGLLAFVLTTAETSVGALATQHLVARNVGPAIFWGVLFDFLILVDVWFLIQSKWLAIPILVGSALGIWLVLRQPRRL